eukprot:Skav225155  [mRNA]  locus=scaffold1056:303579:304109:- [translate_table: standard]
MKKRKGKMLANIKFIGNLFLRQLLAVKVIGQAVFAPVCVKGTMFKRMLHSMFVIRFVCQLSLGAWKVVHDLVGIKEGNALPEEHMIECVCELLQAIGFTLDESWTKFLVKDGEGW